MTKTQELFQDTLACILTGSSSDGIKPLLDMVLLWGGNKQATIPGFSEKTNVLFAVLVNSAMGHARDFDDTHDKALNHGCVTVVPTILAIAEWQMPKLMPRLIFLSEKSVDRNSSHLWQSGWMWQTE